ncbi:MAG: hypothetical protein GY803_13750 [Chloroflexi bacterium]|nr:hypothetical protein [Chloroflexota bacterium]
MAELRKKGWRKDWLWITAVALLVQAFWALRMPHPTYFDAYYYATNGQRLADGYGFTEQIIWQYLDNPAGLPTPSHTYWMPLPSIIAAIGYKFSDSFRAAQFPFWLMAGFLPLLSYVISWQLSGGQRWQARAAAFFTMAGGYYASKWVQPSTFVLYAWTGGGSLLALAWAQMKATGAGRTNLSIPKLMRSVPVASAQIAWFAAGLLVGLSHLTRADGILLLAVGGWVWLLQIKDLRLKIEDSAPIFNLQSLIVNLSIFVLGYLLVMGGWFWRTWQVTGRPLSTVGTETIFLTNYNDLFSYGRHFDLSSYLDWGWGNIWQSKLKALSLAAQTFIGVTGLTVFTFFFAWAWIKLGRDKEMGRFLRPFTWYTPIVFGIMSLVFTLPGQRGSLLHSSTALWPWSMALTAAGVGFAVDWMAARLPHWEPEKSKPLFAAMFVVVIFVISMAVSLPQLLGEKEAAVYREIKAILPDDAVVMTGNSPGFYYHTNLPTIVTPNEPPDITLAVARRYGVNYLILDANRPPPLDDLYMGVVELPALQLQGEFAGGLKLFQLEPLE